LKPIFNSATENYPIRKKQITIFFTGTSIGIQDLHNIVTLCLKENIRLLTRKVSCPQTNFLNINVCKIEYINKCIDDAMIKAKGTRLEKVITDFSNLVQKTYVPVKIDLSSLEQSEKLLGKEGYFLSLMKGNLN
jgi:UDP-N-acetylglucosamine:LPS N-acetylglucosamine transferase